MLTDRKMLLVIGAIVVGLVFGCLWVCPQTPRKREMETEVIGLGLLRTRYYPNSTLGGFCWHHRNGSLADLGGYVGDFDHSKFRRRVLFAELSGKYGKEDVTEILRAAQGLQADFHLGLPNSSRTWDDILYEFDLADWGRLTIIDSLGKVHNIEISKNRVISWNNEFKLD